MNIGEDVEKLKPSYTTGGNVKWHSCFGKQSGDSSKNQTSNYFMCVSVTGVRRFVTPVTISLLEILIQQFHS